MKKVAGIFTAFVISLLLPIYASAAAAVTTAQTINLPKGQKSGSFEISVQNAAVFAGCEFELALEDGISVTSVKYSESSASAAGPTEARGNTYFSFFSGENDFKGTVTATVNFTCDTEQDYTVTLKTAKVYTIAYINDVMTPQEEVKTLNQVINIKAGKSGGDDSSNSDTPSKGGNDSSKGDTSDPGKTDSPNTGNGLGIAVPSLILVGIASATVLVICKKKSAR